MASSKGNRKAKGGESHGIVVVGGGICGLATALALHRKGLRSLMLEKYGCLREDGGAIGINTNGQRALEQLGVARNIPITAPWRGMVTFNGSFDHMNIDSTSVQMLEIIDPLHTELSGTSNKKKSLFQMLKTTKTTGGSRLLRANLLQPLKDIQTINTRLDCLDELMSNEELFFGLTQGLRKFPKESDKVLCHFCFKPKKVTDEVLKPANGRKSQMLISDIIVLKTALDAIPFLSKVLLLELSERETDELCGECGQGGDIFPCKICPRSFHPACVGLSEVPSEWYCDNCSNLVQKEKALAENKNAKAAGRQAGVDSIEQIMKRAIRIVPISDDLGGCALLYASEYCVSYCLALHMLPQVITKFLKKIEGYTIRCKILKGVSGYIVGYGRFYLDK